MMLTYRYFASNALDIKYIYYIVRLFWNNFQELLKIIQEFPEIQITGVVMMSIGTTSYISYKYCILYGTRGHEETCNYYNQWYDQIVVKTLHDPCPRPLHIIILYLCCIFLYRSHDLGICRLLSLACLIGGVINFTIKEMT